MRLKDKIAIVTGGSQGIGEAISYAYAKEGATVIIVNKNNPTSGKNIAAKIIDMGGRAEAIICDVANEESTQHLIETIIKKYGRIDILVNNAGVVVFKNFEEQTLDDWNHVMDINLKGPFLLCRAAIPYMKKQKYGKIIFVSSAAATMGYSGVAPYSASKGGLLAMARTMVAELAQYNINVNSISPATTATPINQEVRDNPDFIESLTRNTPTGIPYMQPEDIAGAAVFLASEESKTIHGLDLKIDSGQTVAIKFF